METAPYLNFNGNCEEAFKFYEQVFNGKIEALFRHAGTPAAAHVPPEWQEKIMHVRLSAKGMTLMASDAPPGHYRQPQGFSVSVSLADKAEGERIFQALAEGGSVQMPFQQTFWAAGFGMLTDRFGIPWMINCEAQE